MDILELYPAPMLCHQKGPSHDRGVDYPFEPRQKGSLDDIDTGEGPIYNLKR
jgi:hypothetical protein